MTIRRPLDGMLVLDLGQIYNGPYCGLQLGFMGARVLKIEPPEGDVVRRRKREVEPWPLVMLNSNKESVVLDLKQPRGKELFLELVAKADVLIENFAAGVMDRLGLGYETLRKLNPRLVYGGSSGFGLDGPYRDLAAMDVTIQAMSGITNATGDADGPPTKAGAAVCDFLAGIHLCAGILGALVQRERTGQGQRVEVAMHEAAVTALASAMGAVMDGDTGVPDRTGNRHPALAMAPYNTYPCSDGYVAIFTAAERHWHSMCAMLGRPELASDPEFGNTVARARNMAAIDDIVGAWTIGRTKDEVVRLLNDAHVPCAPVKTAREVSTDPHLEARGYWVDVDHPRRGRTRVPISAIRLHAGGRPEIRSPAPTLGQHTEKVLTDLLGLKAAELAELRAARVTEPVTAKKS
ncbi:CaiB/BaiF CoA transferase family protein [Reyranella sp.]|uniref:CaiB/BaiF CoA transferase family protein n=1 Tax=Reyranella sp. TaxID=1929291 RepID=UPI003BA8B1F8